MGEWPTDGDENPPELILRGPESARRDKLGA
jgi:hypothetical protein